VEGDLQYTNEVLIYPRLKPENEWAIEKYPQKISVIIYFVILNIAFEQKGLTILCEFSAPDLPDSHPYRFSTFESNIEKSLSNAIKFTENVVASASKLKIIETTLNILLLTQELEYQKTAPAIFEAFQQAEGGTSRKIWWYRTDFLFPL
jgi:hypothetical protein